MIDEFTSALSLNECISRLKGLPLKCASVNLAVNVVPLGSDRYVFDLRAVTAPGSRHPMNVILSGSRMVKNLI
jgi:hypothetical protein